MDELEPNPDWNNLWQLMDQLQVDGAVEATFMMGLAQQAYYEHTGTGQLDSINQAVGFARLSLELAPGESTFFPTLLNCYGVILITRFERRGDKADLAGAIQATQKAINLTPEGYADRAGYLSNLGNQLEHRYARFGERADLEEAIQAAREAVNLTTGNDLDRAGRLNNLGNKLETLYWCTGQRADLEMAIQAALEAIDSTPEDNEGRARRLNNLGGKLGSRYRHTGERADLEEAIQIIQQAVDLTPNDHAHRASYLGNLSDQLYRRYKLTGLKANLEEAIQTAQKAVDLTPEDHLERAGRLISLGNTLESWSERTGERAGLVEAVQATQNAIEITQNAIDLIPEDSPKRAAYLNSLGNHLESRYELTGEKADLEEAIRTTQRALDSTPEDHPERTRILINLGGELLRRYERTGDIADLDDVIQTTQIAINSAPEGDPDRAGYLSNFGNYLESRYERTGETAYLEAAIQAAQKAVDLSLNHTQRAFNLSNLGSKFETRYDRTGEISDLEHAIQAAQTAVDLTAEDHPARGRYLNNLGAHLNRRYEQTGEWTDLKDAIQAAQKAVELTLEDHPVRAGFLNNLGNVLENRYKRKGNIADLEDAIQTAQKAVDSTPEDHPDRTRFLKNLGSKVGQLYLRTGQRGNFEKSGDMFSQAWNCKNGIPFHRLQAAILGVKFLGLALNLEPAALLSRQAIDLLPIVNTRTLSRIDQQHAVSYFSGLAATACSIHLALGQQEQALEILEQGRFVILGQLLSDRGDISRLSEVNPDMARRFETLRNEISLPIQGRVDSMLARHIQNQRRINIEAFGSCVEKIRNIPGYDRFLLALTPAAMRKCASRGTIVVVNVTELGSHAILVTPVRIKSLELPRLSATDAQRWLNMEWSLNRQHLERNNRKFREYQYWLWEVCVKPIVAEGEFKLEPSKERLPRIWWIGTGLASSMPFHAAGKHDPSSEQNLFNRAISSYSPSIRALAYTLERSHQENEIKGLLLSTMATTPGLPGLRGVEDEKKAILGVIPNTLTAESLDHPTANCILTGIQHCSIAHFACHGFTNSADPSESGLVFQKWDECLSQDVVTVHDVSELKLEYARIAYLSACSTAENKPGRLEDEVIHIVSGFQVAGFPHVVGCLWPSGDAVCVRIAKGFYETLFRGPGRSVEDKDIAMALHESVRKERATLWNQPLKWAQFVHYGS